MEIEFEVIEITEDQMTESQRCAAPAFYKIIAEGLRSEEGKNES